LPFYPQYIFIKHRVKFTFTLHFFCLAYGIYVLHCEVILLCIFKMGSQKLLKVLSDASSNSCNKNEKKVASFRRWLLWIPLVVLVSLLYILDIGGELHYHTPLPHNIMPGK